MQNPRFTIVALVIMSAWSCASFADGSPAAAQCVALIKSTNFLDAVANALSSQ